jgi:DNA helicase HerA-like ATPase
MYENGSIYMGITKELQPQKVMFDMSQANRHGLIAGASGTGKTITMKVMAESFSDAGVPVFVCDVKGDVSGLAEPGEDNEGMQKRIDRFGIRDTFSYKSYPVTFWDIYGKGGHPIRTTVSDFGPELLSQIMGLSEIQEGVLNIAFRVADDNGLKILDLKDLRAVLNHISDNRIKYSAKYGNIASASINSITRAILPLEDQGGDKFFGEPALDINDWFMRSDDGRGMINVLHAVEVIQKPKLYCMFLMWMLAELFEQLPEAGDADKPKFVFFFDEAHLLFKDVPKAFLQLIEQTVKLIRSKGVGIYFVTQSPSDIPDPVLAQLSNRVQHALRAYTPAEQKAVRTAAQTFRVNPDFKTEDAIMNLGTGEALTSFLDAKGIPQIVQYTKIICPQSLMAPCSSATKAQCMAGSLMGEKYDEPIDNISAYEILTEQAEIDAEIAADELALKQAEKEAAEQAKQEEKERLAAEKAAAKEEERQRIAEEKEALRQKIAEEKEAQRLKLAAEKEELRQKIAAEKLAQKEKEKAEKKAEEERKKKEKQKAQRQAKIESQFIQAGGQVLKRGLLGILKLK